MRIDHRHAPWRATLLLAILAVAMLARALVPAGWMPAIQGDRVRLILCDGTATAAIAPVGAMAGMAHHGRDAPAHHPGGMPDHPCAFAGAVAALASPLAASPPILRPAAAVALPERRLVSIGRGLAAPPPPPTGPPAFA